MNKEKLKENLSFSKKYWKKPKLISLSIVQTFGGTEGEFDGAGFEMES